MLINTLSNKKLAEESQATGSGIQQQQQQQPPPSSNSSSSSSNNHRRHSTYKSDSSSNNSNSSPIQLSAATILPADLTMDGQEMPLIISLSDSGDAIADHDNNLILDESHLKGFEELACVVCRRIDLSAKNRLVECTKCNSLYNIYQIDADDCIASQIDVLIIVFVVIVTARQIKNIENDRESYIIV